MAKRKTLPQEKRASLTLYPETRVQLDEIMKKYGMATETKAINFVLSNYLQKIEAIEKLVENLARETEKTDELNLQLSNFRSFIDFAGRKKE